MRQYSNQVAFVTGNSAFTGSIDRIYAPVSGCVLTSVEFGQNQNPYSAAAVTSKTPVVGTGGLIYIPVGSYLEGPIIQFKTYSGSLASPCRNVIAYLNNY
tara:strand:- start:3953 stop:4252 length:300 start_codon:yes stop_codon:yes gene_type:complete